MREIKYTYTCQRNNGHIFHKIFTIDELKEWQARYWDMINNIGGTDKTFWRQYTGLKDKNGQEIYEGDILKYRWEWRPYPDCNDDEIQATYITQQVVFHDACFWFSGGGFENIQHFMDKPEDIEVIGNIYENPELLSQ